MTRKNFPTKMVVPDKIKKGGGDKEITENKGMTLALNIPTYINL
jgi:hypothetical protein